MEERQRTATTSASAVDAAKRRCAALTDTLRRISETKLSPSLKDTLLRLIHSELTFLNRLSDNTPPPLSFNIGHIEAVVHVLLQPNINAVSRVCKSINLSPARSVYVDVVCSLKGNPVWFIVTDRNPRYISWNRSSDKSKGLKEKVQQVIDVARESSVALRPSSIVFLFSNGLGDDLRQKLRDEFGAVDMELEYFSYEEMELENEWMNVIHGRMFPDACVVEVHIDGNGKRKEEIVSGNLRMDSVSCKKHIDYSDLQIGTSLHSLVSGMKCWCCSGDDDVKKVGWDGEAKLVNFDTTAMVAIVSGISNGGSERLLATPESELRGRFKGNYEFVLGQVESENQNPIHRQLSATISGKQGIICESVRLEFQELVSMCGGPTEKLRAEYFMKFLKVVEDCPSERMMSLPTTRNLALKNKVVFGTGDYWCAPTVTANMAFVRAISQTGMSLTAIHHTPRALIGE